MTLATRRSLLIPVRSPPSTGIKRVKKKKRTKSVKKSGELKKKKKRKINCKKKYVAYEEKARGLVDVHYVQVEARALYMYIFEETLKKKGVYKHKHKTYYMKSELNRENFLLNYNQIIIHKCFFIENFILWCHFYFFNYIHICIFSEYKYIRALYV